MHHIISCACNASLISRYHWVCVGLTCKPARGSEWLCTSCSGSNNSSKFKRKASTPEVKNKRARSPDEVEESSKRLQVRNDLNEEADPRATGKKDEGVKKTMATEKKTTKKKKKTKKKTTNERRRRRRRIKEEEEEDEEEDREKAN